MTIKAIAEAANAQVVGLAAQAATNASEIDRVLTDCRTFVAQTGVESEAAKLKLTQEVEALQIRFRETVQFVDGVPDNVAGLNSKLEAITNWLAQNQLVDTASNLAALQVKHDTMQENADRRFRALSTEISVTRSAVGSGAGNGGQGSAWVENDRNGVKPTTARWKKWRRDFEGFIDTIGPS